MKRPVAPTLLLFAALIAVLGCKKEQLNPVTGTWIRNGLEVNGKNLTLKYVFKTDGSFEYSSTVADNTLQAVNYNVREAGTYQLTGNQLQLNNISTYLPRDSASAAAVINQLALSTTSPKNTELIIQFSAKRDSLGINTTFPCPLNVNCNTVSWYKKL